MYHWRFSSGLIFTLLVSACAIVENISTAQTDLPPEVRADLFLSKAKQSMAAEKWADAIAAFKQVSTLAMPLPDEFYFQYGKALWVAGDKPRRKPESWNRKKGGSGSSGSNRRTEKSRRGGGANEDGTSTARCTSGCK